MTAFDVFISHNPADEDAAEALARRLIEAGLKPFFARWHLVPGEPRIAALEAAVEESATLAMVFGPDGVSESQDDEKELALHLAARARRQGRRVIPVILPGGRQEDVTGFIRLRSWVDLGEPDGFSRLITGIKDQPTEPSSSPDQNGDPSPTKKPPQSHESASDAVAHAQDSNEHSPHPKGSNSTPITNARLDVPSAPIPRGAPPVDVVLLTALHEEYLAILEVDLDAVDPKWEERPDGPNGRSVARRRFRGDGDHAFTVLATYADGMAGNSAAAMAGMLVSMFKPRCLAMTGIAAGARGKVELGDVVFGRVLFTHDTGKMTATGRGTDRAVKFKGDPDPYRLDPRWKRRIEAFGVEHNRWLARTPPKWARNKPLTLERQGQWVLARLLDGTPPAQHADRTTQCPTWKPTIQRLRDLKLMKKKEVALTKKGEDHARQHADLHPDGPDPVPSVRMHLGDIATGSAVIQDDEIFARIEASMRKTIGLEMEAAAIAAAAALGGVPWLVAKAVCDFGDRDKDDRFHAFAARASAECLLAFLRKHSDLLGPREDGLGHTPVVEPLAGDDTSTAQDGPTTAVRYDLDVPEWTDAVQVLTRVLRSGPSVYIGALASELGLSELPPEEGARRVARAIDELGAGPDVAKRLLTACIKAVRSAKQEQPERRHAIVDVAVEIALTWLPRRYRSTRRAWRVVGRADAASDGYCDDLVLETRDPIMIDVHVSGAEGVASNVKVTRRPVPQGGAKFDFIGVRSLPEAEAALAEMKSAQDVAKVMEKGYADKFGMTPGQSESYRRDMMRSYLETRRDIGDPHYLVDRGQATSERTLSLLKQSYPALRLVTTMSSADQFEAVIVPKLRILLIEADESVSPKP